MAVSTNSTKEGAGRTGKSRSDLQKELDRQLVESVLSRDKERGATERTAPVSSGAAAYRPQVKGTADTATVPAISKKSPDNQGVITAPALAKSQAEIAREKAEREEAQAQALMAQVASQKQLRRILVECSAILAVNHECLRMDGYPDNLVVAKAAQFRDMLIFAGAVSLCLVGAGLYGWIPAWLAGSAFGVFCLSVMLWTGPVRRALTKGQTLSELLEMRKQLEFRAFNHVRLLEGENGLAWRCAELERFNGQLGKRLFRGLMMASRKQFLLSLMKSRKHILLYHQFVLEAERAYQRAQNEYMRIHFSLLDQGALDDEPSLRAPLPQART